MYKSKDGKAFGNHEMGKHYDRTRESHHSAAPAEESEHEERPIEEHVAEHGPADHVEIHSHHGGKVHKSMHHDVDSAKEHIGKAFGEHEGGMEHSEPDGDEMASIPTMR